MRVWLLARRPACSLGTPHWRCSYLGRDCHSAPWPPCPASPQPQAPELLPEPRAGPAASLGRDCYLTAWLSLALTEAQGQGA